MLANHLAGHRESGVFGVEIGPPQAQELGAPQTRRDEYRDRVDQMDPDCSLPFLNWHSCAAKKRSDQAGAFML